MRITSKGQITIPLSIRKKFGLLPGTDMTFEIEGSTVLIRKVTGGERGRGRRLTEQMRGRAKVRMTTDEILALTRKR